MCRKLTVEKFRKKALEFCKSKKQKSYGEQKHGLGQRTKDNSENETLQNKKIEIIDSEIKMSVLEKYLVPIRLVKPDIFSELIFNSGSGFLCFGCAN